MAWLIGFALSWIIWLKYSDKNRWREIIPVCIFASWISFITEALMYFQFHLWSYSGQPLWSLLGNALGIYIVVTYLFIQWLPANRILKKMFVYFFLWTGFVILVEFAYNVLGHISYRLWWNIGCSYLADWFLFWIFYKYYVALKLKSLSLI